MERLAESDAGRILDFAKAADDRGLLDPAGARGFIVARLPSLAGADGAILSEWDPRTTKVRISSTDRSVAATRERAPELFRSILARGGHPIVARWQRSPDAGAIRMSDVIDRRSFYRLELFDAFLRPHGIERSLGVRSTDGSFDTAGGFDIALYRTGTRTSDFTERDAAFLVRVGMHVRRILQRADVQPFVIASIARLGLTRREAEVAAWLAAGKTNVEIARILFLAPGTVKKHLDNIYRRLSIRTRTQVAILVMEARWLVADTTSPRGPLGLVNPAPGLTARETAVLALVIDGYSSAAIAATLNVGSATLKSHLDHVYRKLGVSTRTGAAAWAYALGHTGEVEGDLVRGQLHT
jgi:DNA-binding CsgD family transcriptional regulator